jgi:hypothetical protein
LLPQLISDGILCHQPPMARSVPGGDGGSYRGRDLHKVPLLKNLTAEYGPLYARLVEYRDG